jgi:hypothetical protein
MFTKYTALSGLNLRKPQDTENELTEYHSEAENIRWHGSSASAATCPLPTPVNDGTSAGVLGCTTETKANTHAW